MSSFFGKSWILSNSINYYFFIENAPKKKFLISGVLTSLMLLTSLNLSANLNTAYGLSCEYTPFDEAFKKTPLIFSGNVTSIEQSNESKRMLTVNFEVIEVFKGNPASGVILTTFEDSVWGIHFEEGRDYVVYAEFLDGVLSIDPLCGPTSELTAEIVDKLRQRSIAEFSLLSLKQQLDEGIHIDEIKCKVEHVLMFKVTTDNPACVKPSTADQLIERGWGVMPRQHIIKNSCEAAPDSGSCHADFKRYYFNSETLSCEQFTWGGCGGTIPFETLAARQRQCG